MKDLCVFFVNLLATIIQTTTGFGYGIIAMAILPTFIPYSTALASTGLTSGFHCLWLAIENRKYIRWKILLSPIFSYIIFSTITSHIVADQSNHLMVRILGGFLIALSIYLLIFSQRIKINPSPVAGIIAGGLGGICHAAFGMGGPPIVVYLLAATATPLEYLACIQAYFSITTIYLNLIRLFQGMFNVQILLYCIGGFIALPLGIWIGKKIFNKFNAKILRVVVYCFMLFMGLFMLIIG